MQTAAVGLDWGPLFSCITCMLTTGIAEFLTWGAICQGAEGLTKRTALARNGLSKN